MSRGQSAGNISRAEAVYGHSLIITPSLLGMYQEIHPSSAVSIDSVKINTSLIMMREWVVHTLRLQDFPRPSRCPSGFALRLGISLGCQGCTTQCIPPFGSVRIEYCTGIVSGIATHSIHFWALLLGCTR